jgi:cation transport regulator
MSSSDSIDMFKVINALRQLRHNISIDCTFDGQMEQIKRLLKSDTTGLINSILNFMTHASSVPLKIETKNNTLDNILHIWQTNYLNSDINIDIPRGLRELSTQYFIERWKSSFIALNIQWEDININGEIWQLPSRMWLADGSAIVVEANTNTLTNRKYYLDKSREKLLSNTSNKSVIIRKPFSSWYETYPTPFLVKRGVLFNGLLKEAIVNKQADVIQQIIPYLLLLKSGTDKLAELQQLGTIEELKTLKDSIVDSVKSQDFSGEVGKLIAALSYDVNMEHFIPDLSKILNDGITKAADKNILAGLGMIEVEGFAKNRQETILNPKLLVEEVKDAVADWSGILEEVMIQTLERNRRRYPKLTLNEVRIVPGLIKAFLTDDFKSLLRNLYDRGVIAKQTIVEDVAELDFEVQVERRIKETERNLDDILYPPITMNQEQHEDDIKDNKEEKKPNTPESQDFTNAEKESIIAPYQNIDELPDSIKVLPVGGQIIWLKTFNSVYEETKDEEQAIRVAWSKVKEKYHKNSDGKWVKK